MQATEEETLAARRRAYPLAVGAIHFASTVTRPDLSQAAGLSRFISKWNESHWTAAKHCCALHPALVLL